MTDTNVTDTEPTDSPDEGVPDDAPVADDTDAAAPEAEGTDETIADLAAATEGVVAPDDADEAVDEAAEPEVDEAVADEPVEDVADETPTEAVAEDPIDEADTVTDDDPASLLGARGSESFETEADFAHSDILNAPETANPLDALGGLGDHQVEPEVVEEA